MMSAAQILHRETFLSLGVAVGNMNLLCCRRGGSESIIADMPFVPMCFDDKCDVPFLKRSRRGSSCCDAFHSCRRWCPARCRPSHRNNYDATSAFSREIPSFSRLKMNYPTPKSSDRRSSGPICPCPLINLQDGAGDRFLIWQRGDHEK